MTTTLFKPTDQDRLLVGQLSSYGIIADDICKLVNNPHTGKPIARATLFKNFRAELDTGHLLANMKVAQNLFNIATGDGRNAVTAAIFWLKTRAGWKESSGIEITGAGDGSIKVVFVKPGEV